MKKLRVIRFLPAIVFAVATMTIPCGLAQEDASTPIETRLDELTSAGILLKVGQLFSGKRERAEHSPAALAIAINRIAADLEQFSDTPRGRELREDADELLQFVVRLVTATATPEGAEKEAAFLKQMGLGEDTDVEAVANLLSDRIAAFGAKAATPVWVYDHSIARPALAKEKSNKPAPVAGPEDFAAFEKLMTGAVLRGHFTMKGADQGNSPRPEAYTIKNIRSTSDDGRSWVFTASFHYRGRDWSLPLPIQVEWAGKTPVIYLDKFRIIGLGSFGARILFADGQYAGTWSHGDQAGGLMYGQLERIKEEQAEVDGTPEPTPEIPVPQKP